MWSSMLMNLCGKIDWRDARISSIEETARLNNIEVGKRVSIFVCNLLYYPLRNISSNFYTVMKDSFNSG